MSKQSVVIDCIGKSRHRTVEQLLNALAVASESANLTDYFGCFDANGRYLGTDASENWSVQEFYRFAAPYFLAGSAWTFRPKGTRKITYFPNETNPAFCVFDELLDSVSFLATSRGTGTLVYNQENQCWLIASYHLSFPIPNDLAKNMCKDIAMYETKQAVKEADDAAEKLIAEWDDADSKPSSSSSGKTGSKKGKGNKGKGK